LDKEYVNVHNIFIIRITVIQGRDHAKTLRLEWCKGIYATQFGQKNESIVEENRNFLIIERFYTPLYTHASD
jgi:hypothetical protein